MRKINKKGVLLSMNKIRECMKFLVVNPEIENNLWYIGDSATIISHLRKGDNVEIKLSDNKNPKLKYTLENLDEKELYSDYLTEEDVLKLMGKEMNSNV